MKYVFFVILLAAFAAGYAKSWRRNRPDDECQSPLPAANAAQLYAKHCASCHGRDGRAKTIKGKLKHARNLTDARVAGKSQRRAHLQFHHERQRQDAGLREKTFSRTKSSRLATYVRALKK